MKTPGIDKELDPVDEESYEQAAQLLKESHRPVSVNYESIQASNANIFIRLINTIIARVRYTAEKHFITKFQNT